MTYDPDSPGFQRLYNNEASVFIDSIQVLQNCMKEHEYKTILQSLNKKQQELYRHIMHVATTKQQWVLCCLHGRAGTGKLHYKSTIPRIMQVLCTYVGENPEICKILTVAPTCKAAYNMKGSTIHAAFNIPANQILHVHH